MISRLDAWGPDQLCKSCHIKRVRSIAPWFLYSNAETLAAILHLVLDLLDPAIAHRAPLRTCLEYCTLAILIIRTLPAIGDLDLLSQRSKAMYLLSLKKDWADCKA